MDKSEFLGEIANILDAETIDDGAVLRDFEAWDSLAVLSIVALADSKFGFTLKFPDVKNLVTVADLWGFFEKNRTK